MEAFKVSTDSWHYRIVFRANHKNELRVPTDICAYSRQLIWSILVAAFVTLVATTIASLYLWSGYHSFLWLFGGVPCGDKCVPFIVITSIPAFIIVIGVLSYVLQTYSDYRYENRKVKQPGFIKTAFASFKDKFCVKLDFTE